MKTPNESVESRLLANALLNARASKNGRAYTCPYVAKRQITARVGVFGVLVDKPRSINKGPTCLVECHYGPGFRTRRQASRSARQLAKVAQTLLNGSIRSRRPTKGGRLGNLDNTIRWLTTELRVPARLQARFERALRKALNQERPKSGLTDNFARSVLAKLND